MHCRAAGRVATVTAPREGGDSCGVSLIAVRRESRIRISMSGFAHDVNVGSLIRLTQHWQPTNGFHDSTMWLKDYDLRVGMVGSVMRCPQPPPPPARAPSLLTLPQLCLQQQQPPRCSLSHTPAHIHTRTPAHPHIHIHTHARCHTHTHTHTPTPNSHTLSRSLSRAHTHIHKF